jgi:S-DNA-T family DNA segregation ATPase FtsK/SpoIIIE
MAWRHRWELLPVWTGLALLVTVAAAHAYAAAAWPVALPLGAAGTTLLRWRADRGLERNFVVALGSAATLWTAAAWWASPWHTSQLVFLLLGVVTASVPWWWRQRQREGAAPDVARPAGRPAIQRELRRLTQDWPARSAASDLVGSRIHHVQTDDHGYALTLALRPGQTVADVVANIGRLESALETRPGALHVAADGNRADRCHVRVVYDDPLAMPRPWVEPSGRSIVEPVSLGTFSGGGRVDVSLLGEHMLIGGATRRGSSGLANVITAELAAREDVVLWGIDCTGGLELACWRPVLDRLAASPGEWTETLRAAGRVLDARARLLGARRQRRWRPSPREPVLVLLVDELAELAGDARALFERLARLGRALGIALIAVTQRPAAAVGSPDAHAQLTTRVCLGVTDAGDVDTILGPGRLGTGWRAERLVLPGSFLILAPGRHETPRPARAFWLSEDSAAEVATRFGHDRPSLDPASAAAADQPAAGGR